MLDYFGKYTDSQFESWMRKIIWAYQKLKESGEDFYWTDIRKILRAKNKNLQMIVPYLMEHTDIEMIKRIMGLLKE